MATQADTSNQTSNLESYLGWLAIVLAAALPLYRPWVTLATTAIMLLWLFGGGLSLRVGRLRSHRLTLAVLLFIALNVVSLVWSSDPGAGLRYLTKYRYLLLIPMLASSVRPIYRRYAVTAFELAAGASVLLSVGILVGMFRLRDAHPGNPSPTMAHLDYGLLLALAALMILARVLYSEMSLGSKVLWTLLAALTTFGLMVNIGSAGHLAFAGGLVVLFIHWARGRPARLVIGVGTGFAMTLALVWFLFPKFQAGAHEAHTELRDAIVDQEYDMINRQCISMMMEDPGTVSRFMDVSWVARALERIGDHATNISEYVIYLVEGKDVRHTSLREVKETLIKTDD